VFSEGISVKLGTNIYHVSGHCCKCFLGHGVKGSDGHGNLANSIVPEPLSRREPRRLRHILTIV